MCKWHTGFRWQIWTFLAGGLATLAMPPSALGVQRPPTGGDAAASAEPPSEPSATSNGANGQGNTRDLFSLDIDQLGDVDVRVRPSTTNTASTILESDNNSLGQASKTAELLERASSVTLRRTSAINLDPRVRGFHSDWMASQVDASDPVITTLSGVPDGYFYYPGLSEPDDMLGMAYATALWEMDTAWTATCGIAYATRGPSLAELYSDEPYVPLLRFGNSYVDGNSQLQPEKTCSWI